MPQPAGQPHQVVRVLYAGAADLARPASGLDVASRCHFDEIAADPRLAVTAISVSPQPVDPAVPARYPARLFGSDMLGLTSGRQRLLRKLALLARGGILFHSGLLSNPARRALRAAVAAGPDVVLVDNVSALANLSLGQLLAIRLRGRSRIVVIAHDATGDVLRDRAGLQASGWRAMALRLHAEHCRLFETATFALAHHVVFLSEADRQRFKLLPARKSETLCPVLETSPPGPATEAVGTPYLLFIGSPSFFANAYAIDWLVARFAPALLTRMPAVRILLVGKATERWTGANVTGLGFVDEVRLDRLLQGAVGLLSPVVHGSGIKIKVLEAIARGCAIFAAGPSLRGYEFMGLEPLLDIADPDASAVRVCSVAGDPTRLAALRQRTRTAWDRHVRQRQARLATAVYQSGTAASG